jgi:hypothetical protein
MHWQLLYGLRKVSIALALASESGLFLCTTLECYFSDLLDLFDILIPPMIVIM